MLQTQVETGAVGAMFWETMRTRQDLKPSTLNLHLDVGILTVNMVVVEVIQVVGSIVATVMYEVELLEGPRFSCNLFRARSNLPLPSVLTYLTPGRVGK